MPPLRIAIVGRTNVGKSSLVNRLAGEERLIVSEIPGTTRDTIDTLLVRDGKPFCLVDTAGIRRMATTEDEREKAGVIRAKTNIRQADVVCLILDVAEFPTRQDARIAQLAHDSGRPLVIALNKWDLVDRDTVRPEAVRERVFRKLGFVSYAPLLFVSARTGQRVVKILDTAEQLYKRPRPGSRPPSSTNSWQNDRNPPAAPQERGPDQAPLHHPEGRFSPVLHPVPGLPGPALADLREVLSRVPPGGVRFPRLPPPADRPDELGSGGFFLTLEWASSINKFLSFSVIRA